MTVSKISNISNKKILITGTSGLLGLELIRHLKNEGFDVVGTFNSNPKLINKNFTNLKCDVGDIKSVNLLAKKIGKVDMIFHCAAMTGIDKCEKDKEACWRANVVGTRNMVSLAEKHKAKLIYISTGSIFSGEKGNYKEDAVPEPKNFYSLTKLIGEEAVLAYEKGIVVRVMPIGIHSIGRPQANYMEWLVDAIYNNQPINLFSDVYINAISVESLVKMLLKIPKVLDRGVLHVGSRDRLSKADIGLAVIAKFPNFSGEVKLVSVGDMPAGFAPRPREMWFNVDKAIKLGLKMPNLKDELELVLKR